MPSALHESHLLLFRNRPTLAAQLIREALGVELPSFVEARVDSADLTDLQPAEYRADLVIQLVSDEPVYGIIVEVQLSIDDRKRFVWPAYAATLRARMRCPVSLLVVTAEESVARWAARGVPMDALNHFRPYVLAPSRVPAIADEEQAVANPELAVLSAMAHGREANLERAAEIALVAEAISHGLDEDRATLYFDLILNSLSEAAREALKTMDARKYQYQSDFARQYFAQGKAEGEASGRAALILRQLAARFGPLDEKITSRVQGATIAELDAIGGRLLDARTVEEAVR